MSSLTAQFIHAPRRRSSLTVFEIPELADGVINFLLEDKPSLASYSLTCRQWCQRATCHLFYRISITTKSPDKFEAFQAFLGSPSSLARVGRFVKELSLLGDYSLPREATLPASVSDDPEYIAAGFYGGPLTGATISIPLIFSILDKLPSIQSLVLGGGIDIYSKKSLKLPCGDQVDMTWKSVHGSRLPPLKTLHIRGARFGNQLQPLFDLLHMFSSIEHLFVEVLTWEHWMSLTHLVHVDSFSLKLPAHLNPSALTFSHRISYLDIFLKVFSRALPSCYYALRSLRLGWVSALEAGGTEEILKVVGPNLLHLELTLSPSGHPIIRFSKTSLLNLALSLRHCNRLESFGIFTTHRARDRMSEFVERLPDILSHLPPSSLNKIELSISLSASKMLTLLTREAELDWDVFDRILCNFQNLRSITIEGRGGYFHGDVTIAAFCQGATTVLRERLVRVGLQAGIMFKYHILA